VRIEHNGMGEHGLTEAKLEVIRGEAVEAMIATILRADPTGCGVQWSQDDGDTWETVDLADCITGLANDAILNAVTDGVIQAPGEQPGPTSAPPSETCKTYHVILAGNQQWHLPSPLGFNDTLTVGNIAGGWTDGAGLWFCPDGGDYVLGSCGSPGEHDEGDPLNPGAYHMALVMKAGDTWYAAPTSVFTQESGTTPLDVIFQANDGTLSDNTGSIQFDVTVCTGLQINITYQYAHENPASVPNAAEATFTFYAHPTFGAGYVGIIFDRPVDVDVISNTGSSSGTPAGSTPYCWYAAGVTNWATPTGCGASYTDEDNIERLAIWNTTAGATITLRVTVH